MILFEMSLKLIIYDGNNNISYTNSELLSIKQYMNKTPLLLNTWFQILSKHCFIFVLFHLYLPVMRKQRWCYILD